MSRIRDETIFPPMAPEDIITPAPISDPPEDYSIITPLLNQFVRNGVWYDHARGFITAVKQARDDEAAGHPAGMEYIKAEIALARKVMSGSIGTKATLDINERMERLKVAEERVAERNRKAGEDGAEVVAGMVRECVEKLRGTACDAKAQWAEMMTWERLIKRWHLVTDIVVRLVGSGSVEEVMLCELFQEQINSALQFQGRIYRAL